MKQASLELSLSVKKTRKREFLEQMDKVVPWLALIELIAPYYPGGKKGRPQTCHAKPGVAWHVAMRPGKRKALNKSDPLDQLTGLVEKAKAGI